MTQVSKAEWTGGLEGSTVVRDAGNALRLRLVLQNNERPLSHYFFAEWLNGDEGGDGFLVGYNPRYWFNETYYAFAESDIRTDDTFGIDQEIKLIVGLGGELFRTEQQVVTAEIGVGGTSVRYTDDDESSQRALGLGKLRYFRTLADTVKLDLSTQASRSDQQVTEASYEAGLSLRLTTGAVRLSYRSRYLKVGDAEAITDKDSFVSFGYSF